MWDSSQRFFQIEYLNIDKTVKSAPNSPLTSPRSGATSPTTPIGAAHGENSDPDLNSSMQSPRSDKKKKSKIISAGVGKDFFDLERKHHKDKKKILKKGELVKKSPITGFWIKKFFVLRNDKLMVFPSETFWKSGTKSEASIFLEGCAVEENKTNIKLKEKRPYTFIIYSRGISYYLECNSESSMREWVELLIQCSSMRYA
jgi:hypothetical protein